MWRVLLDKEFKAKLKIVKKDDETKKSILSAGTEFKVYDLDNQKYVEQVTTYPVTTTHKSYFTDSQGYLILPKNLKIGHYRIEEVHAPEGYTINKNYVEIAVDSNTAYQMDAESGDAIITVDYENHPVKGKLTGITIPKGEQRTVPTVYLDSLYQEYANGKDADSCVGDVADMRIEAQDKAEFIDMGVPDIFDYEKMKGKLQVRICDREWNEERLIDKVVTEHGDFAAYYAVNLKENEEGIGSIPVTTSLMNEWGVSAEQIQADAMAADRNRGIVLMDMNEMVKEVNETQVEPQERLSDKVQFCDGKSAVMENAERREARLEKAKEAEMAKEKATEKGGIHGKLEKAKNEMKAKKTSKIPKDKSRDLATVL